MSKLKRLLGVLSIVSLFTFSSCVDDTVSPEVTALRNAQVALLNANTAVEQAEAALTAALTQGITIQNTFNSANNAILLQLAALDVTLKQVAVDSALAQLEVTLLEAETALANEAKEAAEAAFALETYLATAGLSQAAQYLADWNTVMFGGTLSADGADVDGVVNTRNEIALLEAEIAKKKVFGSTATDAEKRAFTTANLQTAVATAQTRIETQTARRATVAALLAGEFADPAAAQKAQLVTLAGQKQTLQNEIADLDDDIEAITGDKTAAENLVALFEGTAAVADFELLIEEEEVEEERIVQAQEWLEARDKAAAEGVKAAYYTALLAAWDAYGASLQTIYNTNFALISAAKADLDAARTAAGQDPVETDVTPAQSALYFANELAFGKAVIAEAVLYSKGEDATTAEITDVVNTRLAWDGLRRQDLFGVTTGGEFQDFLDFAEDNDFNLTDGNGNIRGGVTATTKLNGDPQAGAFKALLDAITAPTVDALATLKFNILNGLYKNTVDEFARLQLYISRITSRHAESSASAFVTEFEASNDLTVNAGWEPMIKALEDAQEDFEDEVADLIEDAEDDGFDGAVQESPREANTKRTDANDKKAEQEAEQAKLAPFVAPYLAAYNEAKAFLANALKVDSLAIAPRFEKYGKELQLADIDATIADVKADIERANQAVSIFRLNATNDAVAVSMRERYTTELTAIDGGSTIAPATFVVNGFPYTHGGSIAHWTSQLRTRTNTLERHLVDEIKLDADIATQEAELAALKTELTVLEALLAKYQALVLAAIGG